MYRIIGSRGTGKTCALMQKAQYILDKTPSDKTVAFICQEPHTIQQKWMAEGFKENERIMFIHFNDAFKIKADYKLIDELDDLLETHGFCAYSTSFSHSDYSFLEV